MRKLLFAVLVLALTLMGCVNFVTGETTTENVHLMSDGTYHQYNVWLGHTAPEGVPCDVACNEGTLGASASVAEVLTTITYSYVKVITNTDIIDSVIPWHQVKGPKPGDCACLVWEAIDDEDYPISGGDYDTVLVAPRRVFLPLVVSNN